MSDPFLVKQTVYRLHRKALREIAGDIRSDLIHLDEVPIEGSTLAVLAGLKDRART